VRALPVAFVRRAEKLAAGKRARPRRARDEDGLSHDASSSASVTLSIRRTSKMLEVT
jgi:hypothetical protein